MFHQMLFGLYLLFYLFEQCHSNFNFIIIIIFIFCRFRMQPGPNGLPFMKNSPGLPKLIH